jgi:hypothetical protein
MMTTILLIHDSACNNDLRNPWFGGDTAQFIVLAG